MVAARVGFASFVRQLRGRAGTARTIRGRGPLSSRIRILPIAAACLLAMSVHAQAEPAPPINIPASDLVTALDSLARQSGAQFIYRADQLRGARTRGVRGNLPADRSEEHTSELQSLMRISYAVFCLKKKKLQNTIINTQHTTN